MIHFYFILILCCIGHSQATSCVEVRDACRFSNVRLNETNIYFNPTTEKATTVEIVEFEVDSNVIPVLTDELCKAFPNLKELRLFEVYLKTVEPNALHECKNLTHALFYANQLETLDVNLFEKNPNIVKISIQENNFQTIDPNIFLPVKKLNHLVLAENFFTHLPIEDFPIILSLERLDIYVNELTDLDEHGLLYKFPNLKMIYMHNNIFNCERLRIILNFFKRNGVEVKEHFKNAFPRNLGLDTIDNVECLTEEERFKRIMMKIRNESDFEGESLNSYRTLTSKGSSTVLGVPNQHSTDPEFVNKQEALEQKVFYLIIGCGALLFIIILVPLIYLVVCIIQSRRDPDADYYGSSYYYTDAPVRTRSMFHGKQ